MSAQGAAEQVIRLTKELRAMEAELVDARKKIAALEEWNAALQQSPALAPAEWLASVLSCEFDDLESCNDCQFRRSSRCPGVPDGTKMPIAELRKFCQSHILAAALAATGSTEPTDTQLLDALDDALVYRNPAANGGTWYWTNGAGSEVSSHTLRGLAEGIIEERTILANGGADRG